MLVHSTVHADRAASGCLPSFAGMKRATDDDPDRAPAHDLRMPAVGAVGWLGGIAAYGVGGHAFWLPVVLVLVAGAASRRRRARVARLLAACALVAAGVVASALLRSEVVSHGPLRELADQRAVAELNGTVVSDPVVVVGQWGSQVVVRLRVHEVTARAATSPSSAGAIRPTARTSVPSAARDQAGSPRTTTVAPSR